jgi:hypothetical protein
MESLCNLSRMGASVTVIADKMTIDWMRMRTRDYFEWSDTATNGPAWRVFAGREVAPSGQWQPYIRNAPNGEVCSYLCDPGARSIVIDLPAGPWRQLYALRIVRNILRWELFLRGTVFLHGSCVSNQNHGLGLLGNSRSGKTTVLLNLLQTRSWDYVTEDDLALIPQADGTVLALGWPGCARVRRSMISNFPALQTAAQKFTHPANPLESKASPDTGLVRIFPEELTQTLGCSTVPQTVLDCCLWLQWGNENAIRPLSKEEMAERLRTSWDVLPERKSGARPRSSSASPDWEEIVFDQFLLKSYGVPSLDSHEMNLKQISDRIRGFAVSHTGRVAGFDML